MKAELECFPCIMQQTVNYVRHFISDQDLQRTITNRVLHLLYETPLDFTPPEIGKKVYRMLNDISGIDDPFKKIKKSNNQTILKMYPKLKSIIYTNSDPIKTAAKLAIAGNIIDYGANNGQINKQLISSNLDQAEIVVNHLSALIEDLHEVKSVLYLADNAGELVLDKLFIKMIQRYFLAKDLTITVVVRGRPVINDATREDAEYIGLDRIVNIIDNGDDAPGTILENCSPQMKEYFNQADLIISKGQGNYETLNENNKLIYFLLQAKCPLIARNLGVNQGDLILLKNQASN